MYVVTFENYVSHALTIEYRYENTLIVLTDNGGPIYFGGSGGANNFPLKGGKTSNWEGGIRVNGMMFGGAVPEKMRGKNLTDWALYGIGTKRSRWV